MHQITADYYSSDMRLCQMPVRIFDGFVRVQKSETLESEEGIIETTEFFRRVLANETIKAANAFRTEISRAVGQIGFKAAPLGVLVDTRGLESLKVLERDSKGKAEWIRQMMLDDLAKNGEAESLARCDVDLIALRLHPEEEFADQVEKLIYEALNEKYDQESATLTRTLAETLASLGSGHALVAQRKLSMVGRFLNHLTASNGDSNELSIAREELAAAKKIIGETDSPVGDKIGQLKALKLFEGVRISPKFEVKAAGGK